MDETFTTFVAKYFRHKKAESPGEIVSCRGILVFSPLNTLMSNVLDLLGTEFANASTAGKLTLIEEAIGRVLVSQSSDSPNGARNQRAQLEALQALHKYFKSQLNEEQSGGTEFLSAYYGRRS